MLQQIDKTRDAEAVLLARVYSLILSFSDPDARDAQTEPRDAEKTRVDTRRAKIEVSDEDEK
ncbi:MAG: hypothetical protein B6D41_11815 [Chloroflexi bacterium UTCFX4]|jgi:hypothetical protein|nr:MAG: hypothetical protein B6D41_11815 [Chloroflexi bacterium UTCFX4]